ncbi:hypothetical protein V6N13_108332 [Hibiscus sabdariffa]
MVVDGRRRRLGASQSLSEKQGLGGFNKRGHLLALAPLTACLSWGRFTCEKAWNPECDWGGDRDVDASIPFHSSTGTWQWE